LFSPDDSEMLDQSGPTIGQPDDQVAAERRYEGEAITAIIAIRTPGARAAKKRCGWRVGKSGLSGMGLTVWVCEEGRGLQHRADTGR
jgi:hypothetical protein